ncbi:MAG TPA: KaiC 1, partial [Beijerinckiaceae bacterium]
KSEEAKLRRSEALRRIELDRAIEQIEQRRRRTRAQLAELHAELAAGDAELRALREAELALQSQQEADHVEMMKSRRAIEAEEPAR